jgi:hypothetical protein
MDSQQVEILGRNRLIGELVAADIEVALPLRDRGVDLVAYMDLGSQTAVFAGCPIQMKAASTRSFSVHRKYVKFANIILAYVWGLDRRVRGDLRAHLRRGRRGRDGDGMDEDGVVGEGRLLSQRRACGCSSCWSRTG